MRPLRRNPKGRGFPGDLLCRAARPWGLPRASRRFAHLIPESLRRGHAGLIQRFLRLCSMSHYVVGDIQGCYSEFQQLLDTIAFEPARDRLWLVGDLVNRGPDSLSVLRTVKSLGAAATI